MNGPTVDFGKCRWAAGGSDIGQERPDNEDAWLCDHGRGLFVVADGMGGHAAGEQASAIAIRVLHEELSCEKLTAAVAEGEEAMKALFYTALTAADAAILHATEEHPKWKGMGTTAVIAYLDGNRLYIANVGDSRAYLLRGSRPTLLTQDHSIAGMLVQEGVITPDAVREHPHRNELTMTLGIAQELDPAFAVHELQSGDRLLLCTDGLWDMLDEHDIAQIVHFSATPHEAVYALIAAADDEGGYDNITVVVFFYRPDRTAE